MILRLSFVFLVLALGGCSMGRQAKLQASVEQYVKQLRLGNQSAVIGFADASVQKDFIKTAQFLDGFHISNAEIKKVFPDPELKSALVTVFLEYFPKNSYEVRSASRLYTWKYNEDAKDWFLHEKSPFGSK
jgi:hypothetical protein